MSRIAGIASPDAVVFTCLTRAKGDPDKAIKLARKCVVIGKDGVPESEVKRLVIDRIWDIVGEGRG
jgi:hypothetical protein